MIGWSGQSQKLTRQRTFNQLFTSMPENKSPLFPSQQPGNYKVPKSNSVPCTRKKIAQIGEALFGGGLLLVAFFHFGIQFGWSGESRCDNHRERDRGFRVDLPERQVSYWILPQPYIYNIP